MACHGDDYWYADDWENYYWSGTDLEELLSYEDKTEIWYKLPRSWIESTGEPTSMTTLSPTDQPTMFPTSSPTSSPTGMPTNSPTEVETSCGAESCLEGTAWDDNQ